ncbi:hypothetical protein GGR53DRAFT_466232 [Hypoxylon sp. FL1150]|nr:hypothetical protein GGR53DRAFT_466232 [Hypoxylon sp. FL1150]
MRVSAILLSGLAAVALAAPIEVAAGLSERQYEPIEKEIKGTETAVNKRQYEPIEKEIKETGIALEERQYEPIEKEIKETKTE